MNLQESQTVELKTSFSDEVIISLVAFANTNGGSVYIGVKDTGEVQGVELGKETIQNWLNEIKVKTQPAIIPTIEELKQDNKVVVRIRVQEFPVKPISFKGRYYKRVNNSNHQLSPMEITDLNLQSLQLSWDAYDKQGKSIADLDVSKMQQFIEKVNESKRFQLSGNWKNDLQKLKLIAKNKITNAAWLLFANDDLEYNVHIGRFKTPSFIIDDKMLKGTLFEVIEEAMAYIIAHIKVAFEITGKTTRRTEIFEYPLPALRELLLNAVIHRDYLSPIDVQIKIFDNYITFYNPGGLYGNLTIEQLQKDNYQANTRNRLIAESFYLIGEIEKYGSGFLRIRREIKDYPTMKLTIDEAPNGLITSLKYVQQKISKEREKIDNVVDSVVDNVVDGVVDNVVDNEERIITLLVQNNKYSASELANYVNLTQRTVQRYLKNLQEKGIIQRIGPAKGGYWKIVKQKID
jgi:ATP-dependent DNA helicase RecG